MTTYGPAWLKREVEDLLPAGRVGLYEFVWIQRSSAPDGDASEFKTVAAQVLSELLASERYILIREKWATIEQVPLPFDYIVRDEDFDDIPEDGWYVAITPA